MKQRLLATTVAIAVNLMTANSWAHQASESTEYSSYPTGLSVSAAASVFHRDMRSDSGWRYAFGDQKQYHSAEMGVSGSLELAYQPSQHWGVALQAGWVPEQRVKSLAAGSGFADGDYKKLNTNWTALLVSARLKMDYRYYFTAKLGAAYADYGLDTKILSVSSHTKWHVIVPTAAVSVEYQLTDAWFIGAQYQMMFGKNNWREDWAGSATRIPALQQFGVIARYLFSV